MFQQSMALVSSGSLKTTDMLHKKKIVSVIDLGALWTITEDMQKRLLAVEKYFTN